MMKTFHKPIRSQCTLSLPPENIRKSYCFLLLGVRDKSALRKNELRNIFHYFSKCVSNSRSFDTIVLKVASAIKHKNTAEEIIIYTHLQSLLFIIKAWKKTKYNILTFTFTAARLGTPTSLLICVQFISQREATQIWRLWRTWKSDKIPRIYLRRSFSFRL